MICPFFISVSWDPERFTLLGSSRFICEMLHAASTFFLGCQSLHGWNAMHCTSPNAF
ncbi:hypothetical protein DsansV1_C19g0155711 [Dioscorea sansibarensis]